MTHARTRTHVISPKTLIEEIDHLAGPRRCSEFFNEAAVEKLKREKLLWVTREVMKLPSVNVPEWATPAAAAKWVHDLRRESDHSGNGCNTA